MNRIAEQLDEKLQSLDSIRAQRLEAIVREAIDKSERGESRGASVDWPVEYFCQTSGALAGEEFERPAQGESPRRDDVSHK